MKARQISFFCLSGGFLGGFFGRSLAAALGIALGLMLCQAPQAQAAGANGVSPTPTPLPNNINWNGPYGLCTIGTTTAPLDNFCPRLEGVTLKRCCKPIQEAIPCYYYSQPMIYVPYGCGQMACEPVAPNIQSPVVQLKFFQSECCFACPALPGYTVYYQPQTLCADVPATVCVPSGGGGGGGGSGGGSSGGGGGGGSSGGGGGGGGGGGSPPPPPPPPPDPGGG